MIEAYSEQLITIDELRARMPHLRARETNLRGQLDALDAQAADRDAYLTLAGDLEGFLAQLRGNAATATVEDRQRVLRLLVKDVLIGPEKITIRHRIPTRADGPGARQRDPGPDTEGDHRPGYLLRWGRGFPDPEQHLPGQARQVRRAELIPQYTRGRRRAPNPAYRETESQLAKARRRGDRAAARDLIRNSGARSPKATRRNPATGGCSTAAMQMIICWVSPGRGPRPREIKARLAGSSGRPSAWNSTGPRP